MGERWKLVGWVLLCAACGGPAKLPGTAATVRVQGHRVAALARAEQLPRDPAAAQQAITLTVVLDRADEAGFQTFAEAVRDPAAREFRSYSTQRALAERFGPSQASYDAVRAYLEAAGFALSRGSQNRLTLTVTGTRAQAEQAFGVSLDDYRLNGRTFYANDQDPVVPAALPIHAVIGLSDFVRARPLSKVVDRSFAAPAGCPTTATPTGMAIAQAYDFPALGTNGAGQTLGLVELADYLDADVTSYLTWANLPASMASQVKRVAVNGGSPSSADSTLEDAEDIELALGAAPGADISVFVAPEGTSFETIFNQMVDDGVTVISNSWGYCEWDSWPGDLSSIDSILASAAASGISVFSAAGDTGSVCEDSLPDATSNGTTEANVFSTTVPADSPHLTSVGGTELAVTDGGTYGEEGYWNSGNWGGGGFGVSTFFAEPSWQLPYFPGGSGRSVPDVAAESLPGIFVCAKGQCPWQIAPCGGQNVPTPVGGTSLAAPIWAAGTALINQSLGGLVGNYNSVLYGVGDSDGFHAPAGMTAGDNDFTHLGLGSFDLAKLATALEGARTPTVPDGGGGGGSSGGGGNNGPTPVITRLTPATGTGAGGTSVTVQGSNLQVAGSPTSFYFGAIPAKGTCSSATQCTVTSPCGAGVEPVVVVAGGVASAAPTTASKFSYTAPLLSGVSPASGWVPAGSSGPPISIKGTFGSAACLTPIVMVGQQVATGVSCTATGCTATLPPNPVGPANVTVTFNGSASGAETFTYLGPVTLTGVTPASGSGAGGTKVTFTGTNFTGTGVTTTFTFGTTQATSVRCSSSTQCTGVTPAGTGAVGVTATCSGAGQSTATLNGAFTFVPQPTVSGLSPNQGPSAGGTVVTLSGTNLTSTLGATTVTFAGKAVAGAQCTSTACTVTSPAGSGTAAVVVNVAGVSTASSAATSFSFVPAPAISSVNPRGGPLAGGTKITILGANLTSGLGATSVTVGGAAATSLSCTSSSECTAVTPAGAGEVDVLVTAGPQTSTVSAADKYTFVGAPIVTGVSPAFGSAAGGTRITITGTNLYSVAGLTGVTVGGKVASGVSCPNSTQCAAVTPAGSGQVDVLLTTGGQSSTVVTADEYNYVPLPTVSGLNPSAGPAPGGTTVTISGANLTSTFGPTAVTFGGRAATAVQCTAVSCTVVSPAGSGTAAVLVSVAGVSSTSVAADEYAFVGVPEVSSLSPKGGALAGGTNVTITGTNLTSVLGATQIAFGSLPATSVTCHSSSQCTAVSPAGQGQVDVLVTVGPQKLAIVPGDKYVYVAAPVVTGVSPDFGAAGGGTHITITGTNLSSAAGLSTATVGGKAATGVSCVSSSQCAAVTPAGVGTVDVLVASAGQTSTAVAADQFSYVPLPTVTGLSPTAGPAVGGTMVTISGTNLSSDLGLTTVTFGTKAATNVQCTSTSCSAVSPAGVGTVAVQLLVAGASRSASAVADEFTFVGAPVVSSVSPKGGALAGGTQVTIRGANLTSALGSTTVMFGTNAAASASCTNSTECTAVSPAGTGQVDIYVTAGPQSSTGVTADEFSYLAAPVVTGVTPGSGPATGRTEITITGANLSSSAGVTSVTVGGKSATSVLCQSSTQCTAYTPAGTGTVDVLVTLLGQTSSPVAADQFTY